MGCSTDKDTVQLLSLVDLVKHAMKPLKIHWRTETSIANLLRTFTSKKLNHLISSRTHRFGNWRVVAQLAPGLTLAMAWRLFWSEATGGSCRYLISASCRHWSSRSRHRPESAQDGGRSRGLLGPTMFLRRHWVPVFDWLQVYATNSNPLYFPLYKIDDIIESTPDLKSLWFCK